MTKENEPKRLDYKSIQWVIDNLPPKDMEIVDDMDVSIDHIDNFITEQIENGATFSTKWDYYSDCPNVSMVYYHDGFDNSGYGLSGRGRDFLHAMTIVMYKFHEVAKGRLFELTEVRTNTRYG